MKHGFTAGLAFLLIAGASPAALAQDQHDQRDQQRSPGGAPHGQGQPGQGQHGPAPGAQPGHGGAPPGPQGFRGEAGPGPMHEHHGAPGQGFQGQPPGGGGPGPQHFDRGPGPGPTSSRQFDHERGPHEVIPPGAGGRAWDGRHDGRPAFDARNSPWISHPGAPGRWQPGRAPPVYWAHDRFHAGYYRQPYGFYARAWGFGDFLPRGWYTQSYWIDDFLDYGLPYPPPGFEWVRVGDDAILVDQYTGRVVQVVRGIFW